MPNHDAELLHTDFRLMCRDGAMIYTKISLYYSQGPCYQIKPAQEAVLHPRISCTVYSTKTKNSSFAKEIQTSSIVALAQYHFHLDRLFIENEPYKLPIKACTKR